MFNSVQTGQVTAPLWEAAKMQVPPGTDNRAFLREYVVNLLASGFKNLTPYAARSRPLWWRWASGSLVVPDCNRACDCVVIRPNGVR